MGKFNIEKVFGDHALAVSRDDAYYAVLVRRGGRGGWVTLKKGMSYSGAMNRIRELEGTPHPDLMTRENPSPIKMKAVPASDRSMWLTGGCFALADSIHRYLGQGQYIGLYEPGPFDAFVHAGVLLDGYVYDADGVNTMDRFIEVWLFRQEQSGSPPGELRIMTQQEIDGLLHYGVESNYVPNDGGQLEIAYTPLAGPIADALVEKLFNRRVK